VRAAQAARSALALLPADSVSRAKVIALHELARQLALGGDPAAVEAAQRAHELARAATHGDLEVRALCTLGLARLEAGDPDGAGDVAKSLELAEERRLLMDTLRGHLNLGSVEFVAGRIDRSYELHRRGLEIAESHGSLLYARAFRSELVEHDYHAGRWDDALRAADAELAEVEAGSPSYRSVGVRGIRALIRLACDAPEVSADTDRSLRSRASLGIRRRCIRR
jgi:hypothetical protein